MKTDKSIRVSQEVWGLIMADAGYGDTPDSMLRKILNLPSKKEKETE